MAYEKVKQKMNFIDLKHVGFVIVEDVLIRTSTYFENFETKQ